MVEKEQAIGAKVKKTKKRSVPAGQVHIKSTFNNTIISVTDKSGGVLAQSSAGANGFRGSKKGTAYASQIAAEKVLGFCRENFGFASADVYVKGVGLGRDSAIRAVAATNISINSIQDVTALPHGGVRPKGERKP
ncbi:MAG: 30S ribosomal protein S11 [Candidatus Nomurabacteria bacterium]|jgi:small subunit ribosomal protein S11|nr:30S ribosomal protein S11 [Candidatus Nomurabacteria bacterium]